MEISTGTDGLWQDDTTCIDGLEDAERITSSGDFLDEDRGKPLGAKLLVNAKEIDLGTLEDVGPYAKSDRNPRYESDELPRLGRTDANMPLFSPSWRFEGPGSISRRPQFYGEEHQLPVEEGNGIVESEHGLIIFDVMPV